MAPPQTPNMLTHNDATVFMAHRWESINTDLPHLRQTPGNPVQNRIAEGLQSLVAAQQDQQRSDEARRQQEKTKKPSEYFGIAGLRKLMRWCHVFHEDDLPPIYASIASAPKGQTRLVIQNAIGEACEQAGLDHLDIQITTALSKRIADLEWASRVPDDLSLGLHPFVIGYVTPEETELQQEQNRVADLLYNGEAAPSLSDTQLLLNNQQVYIPRKLVEARVAHERALMLWTVLLGGNHVFTQNSRQHLEELRKQELKLTQAKPRNPQHVHLVPALITRNTQLYTNYWLSKQKQSEATVPVPNMSTIFQDIDLDHDWAPNFPKQYLKTPPSTNLPTQQNQSQNQHRTPSGQSTPTPDPGSLGASTGSNPQSRQRSIQRNPTFNPAFETFRAMSLLTRRVKTYCQNKNIALPRNERVNSSMCLAYHVKGMCNTNCAAVADHVEHTAAEDQMLATWLTSNYKTE